MGWDYYCLLCYAGFYNPINGNEYEYESESEYDSDCEEPDNATHEMRKLFPLEDISQRLSWLSHFRTIGVHREATGIKKCYLSGRGLHTDLGGADIERGDHPSAENVPFQWDTLGVDCYRRIGEEDAQEADYPIHDSCMTVLCQAFAQARGVQSHWTSRRSSASLPFDLDTLYTCLASMPQDDRAMNYGVALNGCEQYFELDWNEVVGNCPVLNGWARGS